MTATVILGVQRLGYPLPSVGARDGLAEDEACLEHELVGLQLGALEHEPVDVLAEAVEPAPARVSDGGYWSAFFDHILQVPDADPHVSCDPTVSF